MTPLVSVIIPTRAREKVTITIDSLMNQSIQDIEIITIVDAESRGQSWARNQAIPQARGKYTLFSDSDIAWRPYALENLITTIEHTLPAPSFQVGYAYGGYELTVRGAVTNTVCMRGWNWNDLMHYPYISTMSLVYTWLLQRVRFHESLRRLEDWALWLELGKLGFCGVWCDKIIFSTELRAGISHGGPLDHDTAEAALRGLIKL